MLGFTDEWFELGVVSDEQIEQLGREYDWGDDQNAEHYRYRAFREYLSSHSPLPAGQAEAL